MPSATVLPIYIEQGATFSLRTLWKTGDPEQTVNLAGCVVRMQIRSAHSSDTTLADLSTGNDKITIDGENWIEAELTAAETSELSLPDGATSKKISGRAWYELGVYDLEIEFPGGDVYRHLEGAVYLSPEVTR